MYFQVSRALGSNILSWVLDRDYMTPLPYQNWRNRGLEMLLEASRKRLASRSVKFILFKIKVERIDEIGQLGGPEVGWTIRLLKRLCPEIK